MADRHDVTFTTPDGTTLAGWLYRPDTDGPWPAITMAHGFGATREHGLDDYERALEPKSLHLITGGHYAPYRDQFDESRTAATQWFTHHLATPRTQP